MDNLINSPLDLELAKLSPFELKNRIIAMAEDEVKHAVNTMLNAGRGNPNWVATDPRDAFFTLGLFAMQECRRTFYLPQQVAGVPTKAGIAQRYEAWMKENPELPGMKLLRDFYQYMLMKDTVDPDAFVEEIAGGMAGHEYPTPPRILPHVARVISDYLTWAICDGAQPGGTPFDLFAVEGSTAGMCYCFDVLKQNFLLSEGDKVGMMVPIFTPYIEIPPLSEFGFDVTEIKADKVNAEGLHTWQYNIDDIAKMADPKYKMLFIVNPSNPPSYAMGPEAMNAIKEVVKKNPKLMILTDDVYGTFVRGYKSVIAELPYNSMSCYSFSKYFGATGWRIAVTAVAKKNVYDDLLAALPEDKKALLKTRYQSLTIDVPDLKFIDRMVAESRLVALNHTAGLSTPQQVQMALMAAFSILDTAGNGDAYHDRMIKLVHDRYNALWDSFGFKMPADALRAGYYSEIDMLVWAKRLYGQEFADYMDKTYSPLAMVFRLATETGCVVLNGGGFDGPKWSIRVSLANLNEDDYVRIGQDIRRVLEQFATDWRASKK